MVIKNEEEILIANKIKDTMFSINSGTNTKIDDYKNKNFTTNKEIDDFIDYNEKIFSLLKFITTYNGNTPILYGRLYRCIGKNKFLQKEIYCSDMSQLDKCIGKVYSKSTEETFLIEFFILDKNISIQDILDFGKLNKIKLELFNFCDIEDNALYSNAKNIRRMYIPKYITDLFNKKLEQDKA